MIGHAHRHNRAARFPSKVTMADVARAVGVSKQTVSAVLNEKAGISEETRARVRESIARLDYHPSFAASSLRARRSYTVGVVIPSILNPYYPELVRGVEDEAQRHGYSLFLCNSDEDPVKEVSYLRLLRRHGTAGLIVAVSRSNPAWAGALRAVAAQRVPVVVVGPYHPGAGVIQILADEEAGFVRATAHVLGLGHERVAMILSPTPRRMCRRLAGFLKAHAAQGKGVSPKLLVEGGWDASDGQRAARQLLALKNPPTAIVAANDLAAIGAMSALKAAGRRVPEDVAVVGYDNIRMGEWCDPPLTTVDQPHYEMGSRAMRAVLDRLEHPETDAAVIRFETALIVRQSTGNVRPTVPKGFPTPPPAIPHEHASPPPFRSRFPD